MSARLLRLPTFETVHVEMLGGGKYLDTVSCGPFSIVTSRLLKLLAPLYIFLFDVNILHLKKDSAGLLQMRIRKPQGSAVEDALPKDCT